MQKREIGMGGATDALQEGVFMIDSSLLSLAGGGSGEAGSKLGRRAVV